jgi:hypothetical protein
MQKSKSSRWSLMAAIGTMGVIAGFMSHMDPTSIRPVQAGEASASSAAKATAKSSSSASASSSSTGGCRSETKASAEATTVIDGETKTVRQDDADRSEACGGRAESKANATIERTMPDNGESGQ